MNIAILGTGNVGKALATGWLRAGHEITFGSRQPTGDKAQELVAEFESKVQIQATANAVDGAEVVVLAVPWNAAEAVVKSVGPWADKILVDATNPIGPGFRLAVGQNNSGGELVQTWANNARVVKAFNTTGYNNMLVPIYNGQSTTMFIAGNDATAKTTIAQLAEELGFDVADMGDITQARYLEPLAMIWITLAMAQGQGRNIAFKLMRR
ncbi:MAG: NADPH-dependent F420 reductase [Caldilineaceae bacterium]